MLRPSYSDLMDAVMLEENLDPRVVSRYTIVLAVAKRARQLTDGEQPLIYAPMDRAVSIAVKELHEGKLKIKVESDLLDGNIERMLRQKDRFRTMGAISKDDLREDLKDTYEPETYNLYDEDDDTDDLSFEPIAAADVHDENVFIDIFDEVVDVDIELPDELEEVDEL